MAKINVLKKFVEDGLDFQCVPGCVKCCAIPGMVFVRGDEIDGMAEHFKLPREEFMEKYLQRYWEDVYNLNFPDNEPCMFLQEKGCGIYPVRPAQCRTFPFWPEYMGNADSWRSVQVLCPGVEKGKHYAIDDIIRIMADVCFGPFL